MIQAKIALLPKIYISGSRKEGKKTSYGKTLLYDDIHIQVYRPIREGAIL